MADAPTASVHVEARPERVFSYFTEPEAMVRWMGEFALLDAAPGGEFAVDVRGVAIRGRYLEVDPPKRLLISWGHAGSELLPPGSSTVEVRFAAEAGGTRVEIRHTGLPEPHASRHVRGWRHFTTRLAVVAAGGDAGPDVPPLLLGERLRGGAAGGRIAAPGSEEHAMAKVIHCQCGTDVQAETDDELVTAVEQHVQDSHPEMAGKMTRDQILGMAHEH